MKPAPFVYHAPRELEEALGLLAEHGHEGKVLAGGQSLVPVLNMRLAAPAHLVDINRLPGLDRVEVTDDAVRVGALVRHADLLAHEGAAAAQPLLRQALRHVAHPVIRNRGTVVGSLAHADPSGELPAILAITDGSVQLRSRGGERTLSCQEFFVGPMECAVEPEELAVVAVFGRFPAGTRTAFTETARRHGDYAVAGTALALRVEDGRATLARVSYVSVTEVPAVLDLVPTLEGHDLGTPGAAADRALQDALADAVAAFVEPGDDIHASADYRRHLAVVQTTRLLAELLGSTAATTEEN
ncbi:FAD binding domain-containing protein [Ornithinimicrobium avium]|uniref:Xanthine dehydrogenase family protein subunit M n=1 Tax=Ornithinimicrobium avium TaxID=2283195 RepID=A0A345NP98_9MICO|nr:FAD binding domain-containing protein [Ornithinimicrobium avium]AXH96856.1 xanthine dehydrogenase family protein subunit M [Ornithinimicrobium avium]